MSRKEQQRRNEGGDEGDEGVVPLVAEEHCIELACLDVFQAGCR